MLLLSRPRAAFALRRAVFSLRPSSTFANNPHIKAIRDPLDSNSHLLTYLESEPPNRRLAIGTCRTLPPKPRDFTENQEFVSILYEVLRKHAAGDPFLQGQAQALAGPGGATLGSGGAFFAQQRTQRATKGSHGGLGSAGGAGGGGAGGASGQGGAGGGGVGGYVHLSDLRNPPDYGRIAFPEDILGSIEVDGTGMIVGEFQSSGTYRILTNEGILGLSDFLRGKLVERLREEETKG